MAILYLTEQQAWVAKDGDCLVVHIPIRPESEKLVTTASNTSLTHLESGGQNGKTNSTNKREIKKSIPLIKIQEVIVLGDITISTAALAALLQNQITITYLDKVGRFLGQLNPALSKNSRLRLAQHAAHANPGKRLAIAQGFVSGKLRNMRTLLMRYNRAEATQAAEIEKQVAILKNCIAGAEKSTLITTNNPAPTLLAEYDPELETEEVELGRMNGLGTLLGYEGAGSAAYFAVFSELLKCKWAHGFRRRVRRPPTDPVNALLSYGYTLLSTQVAAQVASVGFDPYIGFLHSSQYGKPALALDLLEEFRPLVVDSVVLNLFNNRQVEVTDFEKELNSYRMKEATRKLFLQKFEERLQELIIHPVFEYKVSYRRCIELQARLLAKYLLGEIEEYRPFVVR